MQPFFLQQVGFEFFTIPIGSKGIYNDINDETMKTMEV